jgi:hypothetical protein
MAKLSTFQSILDKNPYQLKDVQHQSLMWFNQEVRRLAKKKSRGVTPNKLIKDPAIELNPYVLPGGLYMFFYDPKHKKTLPYYDKFPMVFPFRKLPDGFIGLNMHYLPYRQRFDLLAALQKNFMNKFITERTRMKISWELIQGMSRHKLAEPCVKRYLSNHVRSEFGRVPATQWVSALMMPVARFQKQSESVVWRDSIYG